MSSQISDVEFMNWTSPDTCGRSRFAVATNPTSPNAVPIHHFSNITWRNVDDESKLYMHDPDPARRNSEECGVAQGCTGLQNVVFKDTDGTFVEEPHGHTIVSNNSRAVSASNGCTLM